MIQTVSAGSESHEGKPTNGSGEKEGVRGIENKRIKERDLEWQKNMMKNHVLEFKTWINNKVQDLQACIGKTDYEQNFRLEKHNKFGTRITHIERY